MKRKIAVGPGASSLILIAVVLALSVLTVLTMISARSDEALSLRAAESRQETYDLFARGERSMAKLDGIAAAALKDAADQDAYLEAIKASLPEGMTMEDDQISWNEETDARTLECAVRVEKMGGEKRLSWSVHRLVARDIWEGDGFGDFDDFGDEDEDSGEEEEEEEVTEDSEEETEESAEETEETSEEGTTEGTGESAEGTEETSEEKTEGSGTEKTEEEFE